MEADSVGVGGFKQVRIAFKKARLWSVMLVMTSSIVCGGRAACRCGSSARC
jgi:hypothetical protein